MVGLALLLVASVGVEALAGNAAALLTSWLLIVFDLAQRSSTLELAAHSLKKYL